MVDGRDEGFLTTEEVLDYLQVNLRTVYRLIKAGKIPAVRVGRQWRFRKHDIDAWLESQRSRQAPRATIAPARTPAAPVGRPRVLVADDEPSVRDLLAKTLALAEYDVDLAIDGRAAVERLRVLPYDLLITDLKMPGRRRPDRDPRGTPAQGRHPDHHHHRLLVRGERDRGGQPRRLRLSHQAVPRPPRPGGSRPRSRRIAGGPAAAIAA